MLETSKKKLSAEVQRLEVQRLEARAPTNPNPQPPASSLQSDK